MKEYQFEDKIVFVVIDEPQVVRGIQLASPGWYAFKISNYSYCWRDFWAALRKMDMSLISKYSHCPFGSGDTSLRASFANISIPLGRYYCERFPEEDELMKLLVDAGLLTQLSPTFDPGLVPEEMEIIF
jgi:hypothetical protein